MSAPKLALTSTLLITAAFALPDEIHAAELDCRSVEFVVPTGAGGGTDLMARSLAQGFEEASGISAQVVNVSGGSGIVGKQEVLSRPANGCSLLAITLDYVIFEANGVEAASLADMAPVYRAHADVGFLHAGTEGSIGSWDDARAKAEADGPLLIGGTGSGSFDEAAIDIMLKDADVDFRYVPYDNPGEMHADLIGGRLDLMYEESGVAAPLIDGNKITPVVVAYTERVDIYPDVPTVEEAGLSVSPPIWRGVAVHGDTSADIVTVLEGHMAAAAKTQAYIDFAKQRGLDIIDGALMSEAFAESIAEQRAVFTEAFQKN